MIHIRKASEEDIAHIHRFICDLERSVLDLDLFQKYFCENLNSPSNIYLVAEEDSHVVGFLSCHGQILLHHLGMAFEIQELFVDKRYRGKGIGKLLLSKLDEELKSFAPKIVEVTSNRVRTEAHHFYERNGFKQTHYKFTKGLSEYLQK